MNFLDKMKLAVSTKAGLTGLKIKEKSPEIFFVLGVGTMIGAVVTGIRAGRKHDELITDHEDRLAAAKAEYYYPEVPDADDNDEEMVQEPVQRTQKEIRRAVRHEYGVTLLGFARLYSATGLLIGVSTACFLKMKNIQAGRILAAETVATGLREYISQYEKRNIELNGEESHRMCKYGYKEVEVEEEDPDNGETYKVKKKVPLDADEYVHELHSDTFHDQIYTFDRSTSPLYTGRGIQDVSNLKVAEEFIRNLVHTRGWAVVNDALTYLAMPLDDTTGMIEGWVKGDRVDFGIDDPINNKALAGYLNTAIVLDFNVQGNVYARNRRREDEEIKKRLGLQEQAQKEGEEA